ncbi:hypothetical protein PVT68_12700 [Microbulbifer bruguierae]|uniref:DUF6844 domain-containing protein n=1 Tax=Microbulbifer bruguierae TaxID=3029061 RepID=A0ABY8NAL3_9GAMM|nr:hypothetical protein [Microbulbifer bruguierae]WGL15627.1 hypothetical protein PVT68_12700 [Microbulbifer bruguierae]
MSRLPIKRMLAALALSAGAAVQAQSPTPLTDADVAEINEAAAPVLSATEEVEAAIEQYFARKNVVSGVQDARGRTYYQAIERVSVSPSSPAWVKARQIAYEKALLKAQRNYVFDNIGRNVVETERKVQSDNSSNARVFEDRKVSRSQLGSLYDKALALTGAKLDALLEDAGVDPSAYAQTPRAERKQLFLDSYIKTSVQRAMLDSAGLLPVQTFDGSDGKGNHAIGVVMLRSDKLQQLASDMSLQRAPLLTATKGKPVSAYVNLPLETLASQFGVRVVFDEWGRPLVLSYGQWGYHYNGKSDRLRERERAHAIEMADAAATDALTTFMKSKLSYQKESTVGESISNVLTRQGDEITEEDVTAVIDRMNMAVKQTASARLAGTRTVKRWSYKHPYGHEIIGRVKVWSMAGVEQAKDIASFKPSAKPKGGQPAPASGKAGVQSGSSFDDEAF